MDADKMLIKADEFVFDRLWDRATYPVNSVHLEVQVLPRRRRMDAGSIAALSQWCLPNVSLFFICENLQLSVFIFVKGADFLFNHFEAEKLSFCFPIHSCSSKTEF
jgi:hypothetical protein